MNTAQINSKNSELFFGSALDKNFVWENLIAEKRISVNWLYKLYKNSIFDKFWMLLTTPVI